MDTSDRIDEGYSEGVVSQEDMDCSEKSMVDDSDRAEHQVPYSAELQNAVLALSEYERKSEHWTSLPFSQAV